MASPLGDQQGLFGGAQLGIDLSSAVTPIVSLLPTSCPEKIRTEPIEPLPSRERSPSDPPVVGPPRRETGKTEGSRRGTERCLLGEQRRPAGHKPRIPAEPEQSHHDEEDQGHDLLVPAGGVGA